MSVEAVVRETGAFGIEKVGLGEALVRSSTTSTESWKVLKRILCVF